MKKYIISLLALVLTSVSAMAQSEPVLIDDVYYTLDDITREATVVEDPDGYSGRVDVPGVVDYNNWNYTVTAVGDAAFYKSTAVVVDLPATLRRVGRNAFASFAGQRIIIRSRNLEACTDPWFNVARDKFTIYMDEDYRSSGTFFSTHFGNRIKWMDISEAPEAEKYFRIMGHDVEPNTPDLLGDGTGRISVDADGLVHIHDLDNLDCGNDYFIDTNSGAYVFLSGKNSIRCKKGIRSIGSINFFKDAQNASFSMTVSTPGATAISTHKEGKYSNMSIEVDFSIRFTADAASPRNTGIHLSGGRTQSIGSATLHSRLIIETQGGMAFSCASELPLPGEGTQYGGNYELDANGCLAGDFSIDGYDPMRGALTTRKMWVSEDKQVYLSQGIFMYNYDTHHARFADSQLDAYGSQPVDGYMTMFGQSTTGSNYGISEYGYSYSGYFYYYGDFVDWGPLIGEGWRTMSAAESEGLLRRDCFLKGYIGSTAAKVCKEDGTQVLGMLILPTTWQRWGMNGSMGFRHSITHESFNDFAYLNNGKTFLELEKEKVTPQYPVIDNQLWQQMEKEGAIFLPFAGFWGSYSEKYEVDPFEIRRPEMGFYWTSDFNKDDVDYGAVLELRDYPSKLIYNEMGKYCHCLVRLVRDVPAEEMDEKPDWHALEEKYGEYVDEEDGISNVKSAAPAAPTKVLRGGQILIQRDGKTYNTAGMRME